MLFNILVGKQGPRRNTELKPSPKNQTMIVEKSFKKSESLIQEEISIVNGL